MGEPGIRSGLRSKLSVRDGSKGANFPPSQSNKDKEDQLESQNRCVSREESEDVSWQGSKIVDFNQ